MASRFRESAVVLRCLLFCTFIGAAWATFGHYIMYTPYGTGDTMIRTWGGHQGSSEPHRKWVVECMDGEAMIGILGNGDDYTRMWNLWCKFMFPYKPPAQGDYPYYPSCHVRNMTNQYFCYHHVQHDKTVNTFITGMYNRQWNFIINRLGLDDVALYKCCKTPHGYYIDYTSCYYQPTHDPFWEYYDTGAIGHFVVYCQTGFVMTGITKRINPYTKEYHADWIQCCRVGFGVPPHQPPPTHPTNSTLHAGSYRHQQHQPPKVYDYSQARSVGPSQALVRSNIQEMRKKLEDEDLDAPYQDHVQWQKVSQPILDPFSTVEASTQPAWQDSNLGSSDVTNLGQGASLM